MTGNVVLRRIQFRQESLCVEDVLEWFLMYIAVVEQCIAVVTTSDLEIKYYR